MDADFRLRDVPSLLNQAFPLFLLSGMGIWSSKTSNISILWVFLTQPSSGILPFWQLGLAYTGSRLLRCEQHVSVQVLVLLTTKIRSWWREKHLTLGKFFKLGKMWAFIKKDFEAVLCGLLHKLLVMFESNMCKIFSKHVNNLELKL